MDDILLALLQKLKKVAETNEEIFDSECRETAGVAIMEGFVRNLPDYSLPHDLGLATDEANRAVYAAIDEYIRNANAKATSEGMHRFHDRLAAFQDRAVTFKPGNDYEEFFGHSPPEFYDDDGNVVRMY